jgi:hypothetical protein
MWQYTGGLHDTGKEAIPGLPLSETMGVIAYNGEVIFSIASDGKSCEVFEKTEKLVKFLNDNNIRPVNSGFNGKTLSSELFV